MPLRELRIDLGRVETDTLGCEFNGCGQADPGGGTGDDNDSSL